MGRSEKLKNKGEKVYVQEKTKEKKSSIERIKGGEKRKQKEWKLKIDNEVLSERVKKGEEPR